MNTSYAKKEVIILSRDCIAFMVPSGARILLHEGTEVVVTQALGDSYTVNVYGNLARIEGSEADALGKPIPNPLAELPQDANLHDKIMALLKTIFDPEIPVNIVDLGLIYECKLQPVQEDAEADAPHSNVYIQMTLTAPGCGMGPVLMQEAERKVKSLPEVAAVQVEIVFDPPWTQERMSELARLELGLL